MSIGYSNLFFVLAFVSRYTFFYLGSFQNNPTRLQMPILTNIDQFGSTIYRSIYILIHRGKLYFQKCGQRQISIAKQFQHLYFCQSSFPYNIKTGSFFELHSRNELNYEKVSILSYTWDVSVDSCFLNMGLFRLELLVKKRYQVLNNNQGFELKCQ